MKPSVNLEFDLSEVRFMRPQIHTAKATVGGPVTSDTLIIRDAAWGTTPSVAIYIVLDGVVVVPVSIPDNTTVTLEVIG